MCDDFGGFRLAVSGGFGWVDKWLFYFFLCLVVSFLVVLWRWFGGSGVRKFTLWWYLVWVCWVVSEFAT